ncbi:MAG: bacterial Ig-like domain-containing protein, partial [Bacteroidales bacterium]|nr:bacterial Ig-like domain-containing protein [Bacteroidales bacterium]
ILDGDDVTVTASFDDKNVGIEKTIILGLDGEDASNYTIDAEITELKATITAKEIAISEIAAENKEYDGATEATVTYTANGVVENDDVTIEPTAEFADENVGEDKAVTYSFAKSGEDADNYELSVETVDLTANITAKAIAISNIAVENKEYDGTTAATVTYTVNGVVENDDVTIELTAEFADENVGEDKAVTYSFAKSGDDADNYTLSVENAELKANITAKSIAVSEIVAENKEYDGSATATGSFTYDDSAVLDGESVTIGYEAAFADKNVGEDKTVTFTFSLSGDDMDNYALASETATATANITTKSITISELAAENKEYDGATEATVTYTVNGVVENDDVTVEPTATFADKNVGDDKVVTYSFAKSGEDADNYTLSVETVDLKANIAAKAITISEIVVEDKEYDGTTAVTATFTTAGAIENEDVAVNYTATFDDKNVGENKIVSLTFELSGEAVANYVLASETATAMADITAKPIAISNIAADNKIFDGETTATLAFELEGILENDEVEVSYTANFADKNVGEDKAVTFNFAKSGADEANYELAVEATEPKAAITAYTSVEVTITENSGTETYDGTEKTVTGYAVEINSELYKESDFAFNGTADVKGTNAGEYEMNIVASDFENTNANFTDVKFTVVDGKLTIEKSSETPNMPELTAETRLLNITDVALPEGWAWADETIVLEEGENSAVANYVGDDAGNYTVESVTITITRLPCLHDGEYTVVDAQEATCLVDGYTGDHKCSICGAIFEQGSVIPATGHIAGEAVIENYVAPTCKEAGSVDTVYYCTIDGDLISRETYVLPIVDHVPGKKVAENIVPATTTTEGSVDSVVYCMVGGEELSREHFVLPILDHDHILGEPVAENYKAPTCTEAGSVDTVVYCLVEGEELSRDSYVLPALGHKPSEKVAKNYVAPTCLVAGSVDSVVTCTVCGEILSEEHFVLPALGHTAGEAVVENYTAPTCTEAGTVDTVYYCTIDNEEISRETYVLPMLEHVAGKKVAENYVAPTKTEEGSVDSVVYCTIGGEELSRESFVLPAIGHDHILGEPIAENYKAPTCTEAGSVDTVVYCLVEGEELSRDSYVLPALGHKPSEKVAKNYVAPTCLVAGSVDSIITCTICGEVLSEEHFVLPATGHIAGEPVIENYVAPTCTTTGTVDTVYYCTVDGDLISRETHVLPMLEHVPGEKVAENYVAPTFTAAGSVDSVVYCTIGGEELSRETFELPMLQKAIEKIEVLSMLKTEYVVGEDIDITGAKISVTFNDGSVEEIDLTNEMLSGFDNTLVAEQDITVTYLTFTTTIHVTVNEKTAVSDIATDATSIYAYGHTIVVETTLTGDIIVNDVNGRIVAKSQSNGDRTEIYVPKVGVYAVRIGTVSQKVVVR